ncbi:MAG: hypothetical protein AB1416_13000 [Actinomycetota bacterium]
MSQRRVLAACATVAAVACIVVAVVYWVLPGGSLPGFFPAQHDGSQNYHVRHGVGAFIAGLALLRLAWFAARSEPSTP